MGGRVVDVAGTELLPEYAEWLDRVTATYAAVSYTCRVRLDDAAAGEAVALRVARGLVARPAVFRHWGLPFSGRIAKLAEDAIAESPARLRRDPDAWGRFRRSLAAVAPEAQTTFVLTCVEGLSVEEVAARCGCDVATAGRRRADVVEHMRALAAGHGDRREEG